MSTRAGLARLLAASALLLAMAGPASAADTAMVRVLHASPDAPNVDVHLDDEAVAALADVPFGTISDYLDVPAGDHNVKVYATGTTSDPVIDADVTVAAGGMYTIAATDAVANISAQVLEDTPDATCDGASVRVVHFSADAPAVDIAPAGASADDALIQDLAYPNATDYLDLPADTYDLEVRVAGETTVALELPDVTVEECMAYSVFAIGSAASPAVGDNALQVVVAVDQTVRPSMPATDTLPGGSSSDGSALPIVLGGAAVLAFVVGLAVLGRRSGAARDPRV